MTIGDDAFTGDLTSSEFERETYEVRYDPASDEPLSNAVTEAVAAVTEAEPKSLRPLYEVVDPDALDRVFAPTNRSGTETTRTGCVVFQYGECTVHVTADGRVVAALSLDA